MIRELIERLVAAGVDAIEAGEIIALAVSEGSKGASSADKRAARNRRYYDAKRLKASENVLNGSVLKPSESVLNRLNPGPSRVRDISSSEETTGKKEKKDIRQIGSFGEFWLAYPRKVGKGDARKAYQRALGKVGGGDAPQRLLTALAVAKRAWDDPQFIPHPSTWLNQERWEDGDIAPSVIAALRPKTEAEKAADLAYVTSLAQEQGIPLDVLQN